MIARELPSDEVLASWQHVEQRALDLRAAGIPGTLEELRVRAYLDLLQERRTGLPVPGPGPAGMSATAGPQDTGPDGNGGGPGGAVQAAAPVARGPAGGSEAAPRAGLARMPGRAWPRWSTSPWQWPTLTGQSATPAEVGGYGTVDAADARDLAAAAARDPRTRWCITALHPDGTAAAHGCAPGRHPPPRHRRPPARGRTRRPAAGRRTGSAGCTSP